MAITLSTVLAILIVFAILAGVYWCAGRFGSPTGQKITGVVCLIIFLLYVINRLGLLGAGDIRL